MSSKPSRVHTWYGLEEMYLVLILVPKSRNDGRLLSDAWKEQETRKIWVKSVRPRFNRKTTGNITTVFTKTNEPEVQGPEAEEPPQDPLRVLRTTGDLTTNRRPEGLVSHSFRWEVHPQSLRGVHQNSSQSPTPLLVLVNWKSLFVQGHQ